MYLMSVTPDVSQPEISALNALNSLKSSLMSVIAETPQLEMGPYVAVAEVALASNATTANFREVYSVKVYGGGGGSGGSGGSEGGAAGEHRTPSAQPPDAAAEPYSVLN